MTTFDETGKSEKWLSIYVPPTAGTATPNESYLRLGSPDATTEARFISGLEARYADAAAQPAVRAAFSNPQRGGIVLYTEGDVVQFIQGKSDTRVLEDSYIVHVLDKPDVDRASAAAAGTVVPTYRSYLRLGKPHDEIEKPLAAAVAPAQLKAGIVALAPADPGALPATADGVARLVTESADPAAAALAQVGLKLVENAARGDRGAIDALEALRTSAAPETLRPYAGSHSVRAWALGSLYGIHAKLAGTLRDRALLGNVEARQKLAAQAASDPLVRQKLVELNTSTKVAAATTYHGQAPAAAWAGGVLAGLPKGTQAMAQWSLGGGVALFSDQPITMTTPSTLKVTVGAETRTVLGPTYSETYDVSDDTLEQIRQGTITSAAQITRKKLVTASLTRRSTPYWRTTKFDQAKSLSFNVNDSGTFALSSTYTFGVGLRLSNGVSAAFDASAGVSASMPLSFKVELNDQRTETSWTGGKCDYKDAQDLRGRSLSLTTDLAQTALQPGFAVFTRAMRVAMAAMNVASFAYTARVADVGDDDVTGDSSPVKELLERGEGMYIAATALNAAALALSLIAGVIQLQAKLAADAAKLSPAQPANVVINNAGIKLQCGASFISMDAAGIAISAPQVYVAAPFTTVLPAYLTGNLTPAGIEEAVRLAGEGVLVMDLFGNLL